MPKSTQEPSSDTKVLHPEPQNGLRLDDERVAELLDIAAEEFLANGFAAASLSQIARKSKASKTTFYARFPNKEQLFLAVVRRLMNSYKGDIEMSLEEQLPVDVGLRQHAMSLLQAVVSEKQVALNRIATMEAQRFPNLARQFFELGPKHGHDLMAGYFDRKIRAGELVEEDPEMMSEHYHSLLFGGVVRLVSLQVRPAELTSAELQRHVDGVIKVFLRAYQSERFLHGVKH